MSRDMTITVMCDGRGCEAELYIDLDDGHAWDDDDTKIEKRLSDANWYSSVDGDYCPAHAGSARERWEKGRGQ